VRIFISSVRRGLEDERDALPGLIAALGHDAVRFEDFTAQPVPSRQACMDAVSASHMCLLLLGAAYGDRMPDTALSPTHEEWNVARAHGIPVYAFIKRGADMDADQRSFVDEVERYATGRFRASFDGAADLLTAVAGKVREQESAPRRLVWEQLLTTPPEVSWIADVQAATRYSSGSAILELHLLPIAPTSRLAVSQLGDVADALAATARNYGLFTQSDPVQTGTDGRAAWAALDSVRGRPAGIRVRRDGATTMWGPLPADALGAIIDEKDLVREMSAWVHLASALGVVSGEQATVAAALSGLEVASEGSVADVGKRSSASLGFGGQHTAIVPPEDVVPVAALGDAAADVAREVAARLVHSYRRTRG
jgi:hypothetical protein